MKRIPVQPFPLAGDVLLSDHEATHAWRWMFYDVLAVEARGALEDLGLSCRAALGQIDYYTELMPAPEALWLDIMAPVRPDVEAWAKRWRLEITT